MKHIINISIITGLIMTLGAVVNGCQDPPSPDIITTTDSIGTIKFDTSISDLTVKLTLTADKAESFTITWGDNSAEQSVNPNTATTKTYSAYGTYTVSVTAKSSNLNPKTASIVFNLLDPKQVGLIKFDEKITGLTVTLGVSCDKADSFSINWGDKSAIEHKAIAEKSTKTYADNGDYNVIVTATSASYTSRTDTLKLSLTKATTGNASIDIVTSTLDFEAVDKSYRIVSIGNKGSDKTYDTPYNAVVNNPKSAGINTSKKVVSYEKKAANEKWSGFFFDSDKEFSFSSNANALKVKAYSPKANTKLTVKIEVKDNYQDNVVSTQTITAANTWEELVFNFSSASTTKKYKRVVFIFNDGAVGDGSTYYVDDIHLSKSAVTLTKATLPMTFEEANVDYAGGWTGFDGGEAKSPFDNPSKSGINTSAKVGSYTKNNQATWAGVFHAFDAALATSGKNAIIAKLYGPEAGKKVLFKVETADSKFKETSVEIKQANTWQLDTFHFSGATAFDPNASYTKLIIIYDNGTVGNGETIYFDDIKLASVTSSGPSGPTVTIPTVAAPAPTRPEASVMSVFSETYTAPGATVVSVTDWNPNWGQRTHVKDTTIAGNNVKKYSDFDFQGILIPETNISAKDSIHIDIYPASSTLTSMDFKIVSTSGAEGIWIQSSSEGRTNLIPNQWNSIEIQISQMTINGALDKTKINQLVFGAQQNDGTIFYMDNYYFH